MGVPKFFRTISERYPCLSELVKEFQIPDFDNLYLDMNGIIHVCSHPDDFDPHFSITEEKIFASIFHYIEVLFNLIKPRKLFFMAVDGVAPRAKINQQRARRFRTAKEAELRDKKAAEENDKPLPKERFDSNCITPGTVFMDRLHLQLKYFITNKISTDPLWRECKVILSGHQTPGEGEHKIMDYIRYLKTLPDYDENTRHCLYGLDADLIMLGLCTHEPHFCLLREKVQFTRRNKRIMSPDETEFYLLHLSLLREYLDLEFQELKQKLPFQYDLENIIDDWVLMGFLVGNDFIPNLPELHINKGAFQVLFNAYKEVLPTLDGYLNENGYLNLPRFQKYMEKMAEHDLEAFEDTFVNLTFLEEKTGRSFLSQKNANDESVKNSELEDLIKATEESLGLSDEECEEELEAEENEENDTLLWEFSQHKKNYYTHKLDYNSVTPEVLKSQAEGYIRAIQWNLHYYYQGCQSWSWFYPHHYAPYTSDIKNFSNLKLDFEMGKPFLPFEQLLAVLPAASKNLLPEPYRELMTSPNSPIKDFYPEDFDTDLNGKQHDWEAVVLIPFIDEKRLLEAMKPFNEKLTADERRRNQYGPMHVYTYTNKNLGVYKACEYFPSLPVNHALVKDVFREEIIVDTLNLNYGLRPGVLLDVLYPGFPTLKHIPHTATLKKKKNQVLERCSTRDSMILTLLKQESPCVEVLAKNILGKEIYINWPHLIESRAVSVSDGEVVYFLKDDSQLIKKELDKEGQTQFLAEGDAITKHYMKKLGIEVGPVNVIVQVLQLEGQKYVFDAMGKVNLDKIWSNTLTPCALQLIVRNIDVHHACTRQYADFRDAFPVNSTVFMLGQPHFGSVGRILDSTECYKNGRLKVELETVVDPVVDESLARTKSKVSYYPCRIAASRLGISSRLLSRITGSILVSMTNDLNLDSPGSKINIGLNMKFFKKNEEIPGYTKRENDNWLYSSDAIRLVAAYVEKFPRVVEYLSSNLDANVFFVQNIFPGPEGVEEMKKMMEWVKSQEYNKLERLKCGTDILDSEFVSKIEKIVEQSPKERFTRQIKIKPHLLYKSDLVFGNIPPVKSARHNLLDRVVSIRSSYTVPTGLRGFIIAIHPAPLEADFMYDILFDTPFLGGLKVNTSAEKVFRMSRASFLNVTDATRQQQKSALAAFVPVPTNNVCLRPLYGEMKTSAFAQWSAQPCRPLVQDNDQFKKMWSSLQVAKPQEDALKKILKIQQRKKEQIEDPVKSFFEKVSKASLTPEKPALSLSETAQPKNRFYLQLFSYYQTRGLGQPRFKYLHVGNKVMAQVFFSDGKVYSGLPCDDKESACESAALQALGALGEIPLNNEILLQKEKEKELKILENQTKLSSALTKTKGTYRNSQMPPLLPNPPLQWVGLSNYSSVQGLNNYSSVQGLNNYSSIQGLPFYPPKERRETKDIPEKPNNSCHSSSKKLNASALEFVPLQAITGKRNYRKIPTIQSPKPAPETQKKTEIVATFINNAEAPSSSVKPKRKPKIAANLNLDPNLY